MSDISQVFAAYAADISDKHADLAAASASLFALTRKREEANADFDGRRALARQSELAKIQGKKAVAVPVPDKGHHETVIEAFELAIAQKSDERAAKADSLKKTKDARDRAAIDYLHNGVRVDAYADVQVAFAAFRSALEMAIATEIVARTDHGAPFSTFRRSEEMYGDACALLSRLKELDWPDALRPIGLHKHGPFRPYEAPGVIANVTALRATISGEVVE